MPTKIRLPGDAKEVADDAAGLKLSGVDGASTKNDQGTPEPAAPLSVEVEVDIASTSADNDGGLKEATSPIIGQAAAEAVARAWASKEASLPNNACDQETVASSSSSTHKKLASESNNDASASELSSKEASIVNIATCTDDRCTNASESQAVIQRGASDTTKMDDIVGEVGTKANASEFEKKKAPEKYAVERNPQQQQQSNFATASTTASSSTPGGIGGDIVKLTLQLPPSPQKIGLILQDDVQNYNLPILFDITPESPLKAANSIPSHLFQKYWIVAIKDSVHGETRISDSASLQRVLAARRMDADCSVRSEGIIMMEFTFAKRVPLQQIMMHTRDNMMWNRNNQQNNMMMMMQQQSVQWQMMQQQLQNHAMQLPINKRKNEKQLVRSNGQQKMKTMQQKKKANTNIASIPPTAVDGQASSVTTKSSTQNSNAIMCNHDGIEHAGNKMKEDGGMTAAALALAKIAREVNLTSDDKKKQTRGSDKLAKIDAFLRCRLQPQTSTIKTLPKEMSYNESGKIGAHESIGGDSTPKNPVEPTRRSTRLANSQENHVEEEKVKPIESEATPDTDAVKVLVAREERAKRRLSRFGHPIGTPTYKPHDIKGARKKSNYTEKDVHAASKSNNKLLNQPCTIMDGTMTSGFITLTLPSLPTLLGLKIDYNEIFCFPELMEVSNTSPIATQIPIGFRSGSLITSIESKELGCVIPKSSQHVSEVLNDMRSQREGTQTICVNFSKNPMSLFMPKDDAGNYDYSEPSY